MDFDALSALGGALIGVLGTLATLEYQKRTHKDQLKHDRTLHDEQRRDETNRYNETVRRENIIRRADAIDKELDQMDKIKIWNGDDMYERHINRVEGLKAEKSALLGG